jgi:dehydrogenase/reductase SDR family protein 7
MGCFTTILATIGWQIVLSIIGALLALIMFWTVMDADVPAFFAARRVPHDAFKGKVVLITGASSGIGEALAYEFSNQQATVIVAARRMDKLMQVAERCRNHGSPEVYALRLDVEAFDSHKTAIDTLVRKYGHIDVLVNNAGRSQRALIEETALQVDEEMFRLNVLGPISITKAVLPAMLARGSGHIVNTSSVAGKVGSPCSASYSAAKHAIQGYFDTLRMECGTRGITVTNVCPGPVRSEITLHAFTDKPGEKYGSPTEETLNRMSAERCAKLMVAATWAKLPEIWVSPQPILFFTYIGQYLPSLYHFLAPRIGAKRVNAFKQGVKGYDSITNLSALFGGKNPAAAGSAAASMSKSD